MEYTIHDPLIIADDFGLVESVNNGITFLLKNKKINGASLMANGGAFEDAVIKCLEIERPNIGIHFVLVEEKSLSGMKFPRHHKTFFIKYILGLIKLPNVERELRAQLSRILNTGIKPTFINSHQHLHLLPGIINMTIKLAIEYDISYIRIVNEPVNLSGRKLFRKLQLLFLNFLSAAAKKKIRRAGLECNDYFVGFVNAGSLSDSDIRFAEKLVNKYPDKIIELGCHPGFENDDLRMKYKHWVNYSWLKELEILKNG